MAKMPKKKDSVGTLFPFNGPPFQKNTLTQVSIYASEVIHYNQTNLEETDFRIDTQSSKPTIKEKYV